MFRDFAQRKARVLKLFGTVQNLSDGTVRVVAQGEESVLKKYIDYLKQGSILSRVDGIDVVWTESSSIFTDFQILY